MRCVKIMSRFLIMEEKLTDQERARRDKLAKYKEMLEKVEERIKSI